MQPFGAAKKCHCNWSGFVLRCKLMSKAWARQLENNPKNGQFPPRSRLSCRELTAHAGVFCRGSRAGYNASEMPSVIASPRLIGHDHVRLQAEQCVTFQFV